MSVFVVCHKHRVLHVCAARACDVCVVFDVHNLTDSERIGNGCKVVESAASCGERLHNTRGFVVYIDEFVDFESVDFRADFGDFAIFESDYRF